MKKPFAPKASIIKRIIRERKITHQQRLALIELLIHCGWGTGELLCRGATTAHLQSTLDCSRNQAQSIIRALIIKGFLTDRDTLNREALSEIGGAPKNRAGGAPKNRAGGPQKTGHNTRGLNITSISNRGGSNRDTAREDTPLPDHFWGSEEEDWGSND